jgi:DNA-binding protein HU-beta
MTKKDWLTNIYTQLGADTNQAQTQRTLDAAFGEIAKALASGETLRLPGFGTLTTKQTTARKGRDPRTGAAIKIAAKRRVVFRPAEALKSAVQGKKRAAKPVKSVAPAAAKPVKAKGKAKAKA